MCSISNTKKITAIVPARSGSKRLPGKNIKLLDGKPLIFHTISATIGHEEVDKIIFTTDSEEYADLVNSEYGNDISIEIRPSRYAEDKAKVYDEVKRLVENNLIENEWLLLCLPTSPMRTKETIARMINEWKRVDTPLFTASEYEFPIQFAFKIESNGCWKSVFENSPMITGNTRSQEIPKLFRPNGAAYIQRKQNILNNKTFYINAKPFLLSQKESIDVDTAADFIAAEVELKNSHHESIED